MSKNGRQYVDFGRFHDTLPISECLSPAKADGVLSAALHPLSHLHAAFLQKAEES